MPLFNSGYVDYFYHNNVEGPRMGDASAEAYCLYEEYDD